MPETGRIPYQVWVDKAVFKVYTNIISEVLTAVTGALIIFCLEVE